MQVFLPYPSLCESVSCLDPSRLGNQIYREAKTLIQGGWPNHPASKMWANFKPALALYSLYGLEELSRRGRHYPHHVEFFKNYIPQYAAGIDLQEIYDTITLPSWLGDDRLHSSHRAALLYKDEVWYSRYNWQEKPATPFKNGNRMSLPYWWAI